MNTRINTFDEMRHLKFLGLDRNPFPVAPDSVNFFITWHIDQVITNVVHGVAARKGFMVLTGDVGLGKTTISRKILSILEEKGIETSLVFHSTYREVELLREINRDFGLQTSGSEFSDQMRLLNDFLLEQSHQGKNCAIIIDDAQNLSLQSLELVRMISNLEAEQQKLVQILLIGQPELMDHLNCGNLRQLESRIIIREVVRPLTADELEYYLLFKLNSAGANGRIRVTRRAVKKCYRLTAGNFRKVNILMDRCLYVAFLNQINDIDQRVIKAAHRDLVPDSTRFPRFRWTTGLTTALLGCSIIAAGLLHANIRQHDRADSPAIVTEMIRPSGKAAEYTTKKARSDSPVPSKNPAPGSKAHATGPIAEFLTAHRLSHLMDSFVAALQSGDFQKLTDTIFKQTGYELIRMRQFPPLVQGQYGILRSPIAADSFATNFLLWKPRLRIQQFSKSYKGEEILKLQEMLADIGLYTFRKTGIVGRHLTDALARFQTKLNLPVTGLPDPGTVFMICTVNGSRSQ
jgi:general secretion pathway protein A